MQMCFIVFIRPVTYNEVLSHVLNNWQLYLLTFKLTYLPYDLPFRRAFICHDGYCLAAIMCYIVHIVASLPLSLVLTIFMYLISLCQLHAGCSSKVGQLMSNFQSSHYIWTLLVLVLYRSFTLGPWRPYVFVF